MSNQIERNETVVSANDRRRDLDDAQGIDIINDS